MTILFDKYLDGFRNYINFSGRTTRKDFWWFLVYDIIFTAGVIGLLELTIKGTSIPHGIPWIIAISYVIAITTPTLAIMVRRLHDAGFSGWWMCSSLVLALLILFISLIINEGYNFYLLFSPVPPLLFCAVPSQKGENRYGENASDILDELDDKEEL